MRKLLAFKNGVEISLNDLDREICTLLGFECSEKNYAKFIPKENYKDIFDYHTQCNWVDILLPIYTDGRDYDGIITDIEILCAKCNEDARITFANEMKTYDYFKQNNITFKISK